MKRFQIFETTREPENRDILWLHRKDGTYTLDIYGPNAWESVGASDNSRKGYVVLNKNISFSEQVVEPNTTYEIRHSFSLNDGTKLPDNCTLVLTGGTLCGGSLIGCNTRIVYNSGTINTVLDGTFENDYFDLTWFGAKSTQDKNNKIDITSVLENALECSSKTGVVIKVPSGTFYHTGVIMPERSTLQGQCMNTSILALIPSENENVNVNNAITIINNSCELSNLTIKGNGHHLFFSEVYSEETGNGICIAKGSRFGATNKQCADTKLYNLIITECGNNGLAIIDKQKWVYSFYNITITFCGNIGFLDYSSDNNYYGFNISSCENIGLCVKGGRNRYSTFKVFVCGYNHKKEETDGSRPEGIYWQGVHITGRHHSLTGFDIQECGGELLYMEDSSLNNYIQATLDRPGFGSETRDYPEYKILGGSNICMFIVLVGYEHVKTKSYAAPTNYIIKSVESFQDGHYLKQEGLIAPKKFSYSTIPANVLTFTSNGQNIDNDNLSTFVEFSGDKATVLKSVDFGVNLNASNYTIGCSYRIYNITKRQDIYFVFNPHSIITYSLIPNDNSFTLGIRYKSLDGSYKEKYVSSMVVNLDYLDLYMYADDKCASIGIKDKFDNILEIVSSDDFFYEGIMKSIRVTPSTISDIHITQGNVCTYTDIHTPYGLYLPFTNGIDAITSTTNIVSTRPSVLVPKGYQFFDASLGKPIYWTGSNWVDAVGTAV